MSGTETVIVDLAKGEVRFGRRQIRIERTAQAHRFRLTDGRIVRAITFGERSRVLRDALAANDSGRALLDLLHGLALEEGAPDQVASAVLLALAGGAEAAPGFDECAVEACRLRAWDWRTLNDSAAIDVDRCVQPRPDGGWTRFAFVSPTGEDEGNELARAIQEMTEQLLERAAAVGETQSSRVEHWNDIPRPFALDDSDRAQTGPGQSDKPERMQTIARRPPAWEPETLFDTNSGIKHNDPNETGPAGIGFVWQNSGASVKQGDPQPRDTQTAVVARARFRLRREGPAPRRQSEPLHDSGAPGSGDFNPAPAQPVRPAADGSSVSTDAAVAGILPTFARPAQAMVREFDWGEQPQRTASPVSKSQTEPHLAPPVTDWLDDIARALADECDLRGID